MNIWVIIGIIYAIVSTIPLVIVSVIIPLEKSEKISGILQAIFFGWLFWIVVVTYTIITLLKLGLSKIIDSFIK